MRASALRLLAVFLLMSAFSALARPAATEAQEASWLDGDLASWNTPDMAIPEPPRVDGSDDPRCAEQERPAETDADNALVDAGWRLFLPYQRGWNVTLAWGLAGYDGMCRPNGFQAFVFVDGELAGTVSPEPMYSRTDSAADVANLWSGDRLSAEFRRYTPDDALCCPSGSTAVEYTIEETADGPVLNPVKPE